MLFPLFSYVFLIHLPHNNLIYCNNKRILIIIFVFSLYKHSYLKLLHYSALLQTFLFLLLLFEINIMVLGVYTPRHTSIGLFSLLSFFEVAKVYSPIYNSLSLSSTVLPQVKVSKAELLMASVFYRLEILAWFDINALFHHLTATHQEIHKSLTSYMNTNSRYKK